LSDNRQEPRSAVARRGLLLVLSSPSGAGKTTLARRVLELDAGISPSVSVTTRKPRAGEADGRDYHFITDARFNELQRDGELLEWAHVHGNLYGTPKAPIEKALADGHDMLLDIDWQGAQQIEKRLPNKSVRVFILPPSARELSDRLTRRGDTTAEVLARRLGAAAEELRHWKEYHYAIVNSDVPASVAALRAILSAERLRRSRLVGLAEFVQALASDPLLSEAEARLKSARSR
jgi:guanylate kinase